LTPQIVFSPHGWADSQHAVYIGHNAVQVPVNQAGWKLCHIEAVGLGHCGLLPNVPIRTLETHFRNLMNPRNMLVLPKTYGALGEIAAFLEGYRDRKG
jgi:hypothetical protein